MADYHAIERQPKSKVTSGASRQSAGDRNFKRYFATVPSGMHPLGCGGHQTHPQPRAGRLAVRLAGSKQAAGGLALPGILAWGDGQQTPASRSEPLWPTLGETMGP